MNTATSQMLIDTMVKPISPKPLIAASNADMPSSTWRNMFSSMTMASSITNPTAMVNAISDRLSRLQPSTEHQPERPTSDSGIAGLGMIVAHTARRTGT